MDVQHWLMLFEQKLTIQRYSKATCENYKSCVSQFLLLASKKFPHPEYLAAADVEKYVFWLIEKKNIGVSYQRMTVAGIEKFFSLVLHKPMSLKHLYPKRKGHALPVYLSKAEIKRMLEVENNIKHTCIIELLYSGGFSFADFQVGAQDCQPAQKCDNSTQLQVCTSARLAQQYRCWVRHQAANVLAHC